MTTSGVLAAPAGGATAASASKAGASSASTGSGRGVTTLSWPAFGRASRAVAQIVLDSGFVPDVVLAIARGGLPLAGALAYSLGVKACASINVEFYTDSHTTLEAPVVLTPTLDESSLIGKKVLVVDDVSDTGRTLILVKNKVQSIEGTEVKIATIYIKPATALIPDFWWRDAGDKWILFPWSEQSPLTPSQGSPFKNGCGRDDSNNNDGDEGAAFSADDDDDADDDVCTSDS